MSNIKKLTLAAMFLALGLVLPLLTGQIPQIGKMLCPMHFPVLLCGFFCGWQYGLIVGLICPILRSVIFGMPIMYPTAIGMAFELMTYGFMAGFLSEKIGKNTLPKIFTTLIISMLAGRAVWGLAQIALLGIKGNHFTMNAFVAGAFVNAVPGIILQLILIPIIVRAVSRSKIDS